MLELLKSLAAALNRLRVTIFKLFFRARYRYDVFISYSHRDKEYAVNLKKQLGGLDFSCFIDEEESPPGVSLDPTLEKALKKSAVLVLLATGRALTRPYVIREFERFAGTGRTIIPINIGGALTRDVEAVLTEPPWDIIKKRQLVWIDETEDSFSKRVPSPAIADGIDKLFKYTRRNVRVRTEIISTSALALVAALVAVFIIKGQATALGEQTRLATEAREETIRQQKVAAEAGAEARRQLDLAAQAETRAQQQQKLADAARIEAERQQGLADEAKREAERQQEIARAATANAERQQGLAREAKLEADKQQRIAFGRQLANHAEITRNEESRLLELSVLLSLEAVGRAPSVESVMALQAGLTLLPRTVAKATHGGRIRAVAFSPDSRHFVTAGDEKVAKVWESATGLLVAEFECAAPISSAAFSLPDGRYLAIAVGDMTTVIWDRTARRHRYSLRHEGEVSALHFSPDGAYLFTVSEEQRTGPGSSYTLRVWDTAGGRELAALRRGGIRSTSTRGLVAFSENGQYFAAVNDKGITVWEMPSGREVTIIPQNGFQDLKLSPDGRLVAAGGYDNTAKVWSLPEGKELYRFKHNGFVIALDFNSDGTQLASGSLDATARVWNLTTGDEVVRLKHESVVNRVAFSPDAMQLLTGGQDWTVRAWSLPSGVETVRVVREKAVGGIVPSPGWKYMATIDSDEGLSPEGKPVYSARVWEVSSGDEVINFNNSFGDVSFSHDGKYVATSGAQATALVWDISDNRRPPREFQGAGRAMDLSPDGNYLAVSSNSSYSKGGLVTSEVSVWDVGGISRAALVKHQRQCPTLEDGRPATFCDSYVNAIAFSPDSRYVATGGEDETAIIWEVPGGRKVHTFNHGDKVLGLAFGRGGKSLVTVGAKGAMRIWNVLTQAETGRRDVGSEVTAVSFSPDGRTVAIAAKDQTVHVWDTVGGGGGARLEPNSRTWSLAVSPGGRHVVTVNSGVGAALSSARVWEVSTGREVARKILRGTGGVEFSPDGRFIASGAGGARVWRWRREDLMAEACARLTRSFTPQEWRLYFGSEPYKSTCEMLNQRVSELK